MASTNHRVLITGARGFIGKNLVLRLNELPVFNILTFVRGDDPALLTSLVSQVDAVVHLAGENRPTNETAFFDVNTDLTDLVCRAINQEFAHTGRLVPLLLTSSTQAECETPYGISKLQAEALVKALAKKIGNPCIVFRLPGVFGKWCKPNYNSVVATFCYNIARELPVQIHKYDTKLTLVYIDDVVEALLAAIKSPATGFTETKVGPEYVISLGELEEQIRAFNSSRSSLLTHRVGTGLIRALYATYVSYIPNEKFHYDLTQYADKRGIFVEILKTLDTGQFSYFTSHPGITRGSHYHHTKTEKFLVVKGEALFRFRHVLTGELVEFRTNSIRPQIVDTIPGWSHDITNIGSDEMVVLLWANENYDSEKPDTISRKV